MADQPRPKLPERAALTGFPKAHRIKLRCADWPERLNGQIKRRAEMVGIFPDEGAATRLVGALLLELNDEWAARLALHDAGKHRLDR